MDYDVIVAGAGPAGSITATVVARAGYHVLVLEKDTSCRSPCAGYISSTINIELPEDCIIQSKIRKMRTYFPDLSFHDFQVNGSVVDRPSFDTSLAVRAKESGAQIRWGSSLIDLIRGGVRFRGGKVSGKIIVGADGVFSKVATLIGNDKQRVASCAQYHLRGIELLPETCEIFFDADYAPGGYAWIYPVGEETAKVGLGILDYYVTKSCSHSKKHTKVGLGSAREHLDAFISESSMAERLCGKRTGYIRGALPIGGLRKKLCCGNVLLVGDSAGMADPITGAGINNALLAGEIAGKTIITALENDDVTLLEQYESKIDRLLGIPLARSLEKRNKLDEYCITNELLQRHLPELWVTFREYWS
ncbi:hypothetical protein B6V01_001480 [Methanosarcinales archaeon ex4572_44]|nr:MAG: hypothetical protein B6V01_001480 [Methanosarcinales archaeon ex4572_44]